MEHSYSRDWRPMEGAQVMTTRTIMVHRAPQCPSCHVHSIDEIRVDMNESYNPPIPSYNEEAAKTAMEECEKVAQTVRTSSSDDDDWEPGINKIGWSQQQNKLFSCVARILDLDHLARLANKERPHEPILRRVAIDKSVSRMRQALANVSWEPRLTQWLHGLLMDNLPPSYMASYLDILQTLKTKIPTLVDKMMFGRPISVNQDILGPVLKRAWEPCVAHKNRKLPGQAIIVIVPSSPVMSAPSARLQRWYSLFATMANVVPIQMNIMGTVMQKQSLQCVSEQMIAICRAKIQEIRNEVPNRQIVLVGFNAGASLALQVALVESVNSVVCLGFAYNTMNGARGSPDDRILDITTPVLFVLGQNAARSSQEEIESLREKMQAQTSLVVVGSADDALRVGKSKRQIEGITQAMVDNMIMDEISEFTSTCIINPPAPRDLGTEIGSNTALNRGILPAVSIASAKKRKASHSGETDSKAKVGKMTDPPDGRMVTSTPVTRKVGRPRIRPPSPKRPKQSLLNPPTTEALNMAIQSILPSANATKPKEIQSGDTVPSYEIIGTKKPAAIIQSYTTNSKSVIVPVMHKTMPKVKVIPPSQYIQIKQPQANTQQKMFTLKASKLTSTPHPIYTVRNHNAINTSDNQMRTGKVFTVKSTQIGTQLISSTTQIKTPSPSNSPMIISPKKFTIMKPTTTTTNINKLTTIQSSTKLTPDLSTTNIFDIPIVFADSDGNIQENSQLPAVSTPFVFTTPSVSDSSTSQLQPNRNIVINSVITPKTTTQNKVVLINRCQMKPVPNIISRGIPPLKYTKVVVTTAGSLNVPIRTGFDSKPTYKLNTLAPGSKVEIVNNTIIKSSNINNITTATSSANKFQPIVINVDSDKTTIKNMIKVSDSQIKPNTILIKPGGLRQIPMLKPGILNRNVTVRKVVNLVQQKPAGDPTPKTSE